VKKSLGYGLDDPEIESRQAQEFFSLLEIVQTSTGAPTPTPPPPIKWTADSFPEVKWPPPTTAEVKNE